jgi:hypothetical protein
MKSRIVLILEPNFEPCSNSLEVRARRGKWHKLCLIDGGVAPQGQTTRRTCPHNLKSCPLNLRKPQYKKQPGLIGLINVAWNRLNWITFCIGVSSSSGGMMDKWSFGGSHGSNWTRYLLFKMA